MTLVFDENFPPGIAFALGVLGYQATHVIEHLDRGAVDEEVFNLVASLGGVLVTHDKKIRRKAHEREALLAAGIGVFILTGRVQRSTAKMTAHILECVDRMLELCADNEAPFLFGITDRRTIERLR